MSLSPVERFGDNIWVSRGTFKLVRAANGLMYYGHVEVDVQQDVAVTEVHLSAAVDIRGNDFQLMEEQAPDWVAGARQGCWEAVKSGQLQGVIGECAVEIVRLNGSYVDSNQESMRIAAFMAVWEAITRGERPLALSFDDGRWLVEPS